MLQELNIYGLWVAKQTAKGSPNVAGTKRVIQVSGDLDINRDEGSENWSDLAMYGDYTDWINSLDGGGAPGIEATPEETAYILWNHHGGEGVTPGTNEVQTVTIAGAPTGGSFTLSFTDNVGVTAVTAPIAYNAAAAAVQTALEALVNLGAGNVVVGGGPGPATPWTITFQGTKAKKPIRLLAATSSLTGGAAPTVTPTRTTPGVKNKHTFTPAPGLGHWSTWHRSLGLNQATHKQFNDCQIAVVQLEGSTANKATRITPTVFSIDPGEVKAADPATAVTAKNPFLFTDGAGQFQVDTIDPIRGHSQYQLVLNKALQPVYGDDITIHDFFAGNPAVTIGCTIYGDADGIALVNQYVYRTATPAAGTKPSRVIQGNGSYSFDHAAKDPDGFVNGDRMTLDIYGVKWNFPNSPGPNPDGGAAEISLAGSMRKVAGQTNPYSISVYCDDAAFTT